MRHPFFHIIKEEKIQSIMDGYGESVGVASAILDLDGNILVRSHRHILADFHWVENDGFWANPLRGGEKHAVHTGENGLSGAAAAIVIRGDHLANLVVGPFFAAPPDAEFFRKEAETRGLDKDDRTRALSAVPVLSPDGVRPVLTFLSKLFEFVGEMGVNRIAQSDAADKFRENEIRYKKLYEKSKKAEEIYRSLMDSSADAIVISDMEQKVVYTSPAFTELFGWTREDLAENQGPFIPDSEKANTAALFKDILENGKPYRNVETKRFSKNNHLTDISISASRYKDHKGRPAGILAIFRDISDRKKIEARLFQAQKMESIGTLAGGIAHDFNNILFPIIGYAELLYDYVPDDPNAKKCLGQILKASVRAKELIRQILAFGRENSSEYGPMKIQRIVTEVTKLIRSTIPADIEIIQNIDTDCGTVMGNPTQIHQVLINLCANAYHAMRKTGGSMKIGLSEIEFGPGDIPPNTDMKPGRHARLSVTDTGHGMDSDVLRNIFDPYFTTKPMDEGTGLGLSVVHGIVKSHSGSVTVFSEPGKGATFHLFFPVVDSDTTETANEKPEDVNLKDMRVLLVDDEKAIVDMEKQILERCGCRVTAITGSVEALETFRKNPKDFDIVITDMSMPKMTGEVLTREMIQIRPDIPIILCTGFSEAMNAKKAKSLGIKGFLLKPIVRSELFKTIRNILK